MKLGYLCLFILIILGVFVMVTPARAAGLVPCGGTGEPACQACHVVELGQNILTWGITIMISVIVLIFAWGGLKMVMSAGNTEGVSEAKGMMTNSIIGFIILLSAWLVVDTILKLVLTDDQNVRHKMGMWNEISCVAQPEYSWNPVEGASRGVSASSPTMQSLPQAAAAVGKYKDQLCETAKNAGIGDQCASLQAIMTQESGGNPQARSPVGALGLMQVMPSAARSLDPELKGLSNADVEKKLLDPTYNMQISVAYYKKAVEKYGATNYDAIYASYNGGFGATEKSAHCPGQQRWQCEWDNAQHTIPNTGYKETRDYVKKVNAYRATYVK